MKKNTFIKILLSVLLITTTVASWGQTYWYGGSSCSASSWTSSGGNWSPTGVPTTSTTVILDNSLCGVPTSMTISAAMGANSITFSNSFNGTNTVVIGSGSSSARVLSFPSGWALTNNATSGSVTFQPTNGGSGALSFSIAGNGTITVASGGSLVLSVNIAQSATAGITKTGAGNLTISGVSNTYLGGTTITAGNLILGAANTLPSSGVVTMNGGTLTTGGYTQSVNTLNLNASSTLALGSGSHSITFANSSAVSWAGTTLTITGWTGTAGSSGTAGKIFVGVGGLTAGQLAKISFSGFPGTPIILGTGEVVPPAACSAPTITSTTPGSTACGSGTATLQATASVGTVNWYTASTGGSAVATGTSYSPSVSTNTTYYVDATNAGCTTASRTSILASVTSPPSITSTTPGSTSCGSGTATLQAAASAGSVNWYTAATGGSAVATGTTYSPSITTNTTYYVDATSAGCTTASRTSVLASVTIQPSAPTCATPAAVCPGNTVTITGAGGGASTYTYWTASSGGSSVTTSTSPPGTQSSGNLTTPNTLATGTYTYYVEGKTGTCLSTTRQAVTVTISALPATPNGSILVTQLCGSATLSYSPSSSSIYWQTSSSGTSTANPTTSNYSLSTNGATIYVNTYNGTCWSAGSINSGAVTFNSLPVITTQPSSQSASGGSATFSVTASNAASYTWQVSTDGGTTWANTTDGTTYSGSATNTLTVTATIAINGYKYKVIIGGNSPCSSVTSSSATLTVGYCTAAGGNASSGNEYISKVVLGSISTTSSYTTYTDYTALSTSMIIGTGYSITVTNGHGFGTDVCMVWVDWNQNGSFNDANEQITLTNSTGTGPYTGTITPPAGALTTGSARMRVRIYDSGYNSGSSCGTTSYGEVEDYSITVTAACTSPDLIAFAVQPSNVVQDATMATVTVKAYCSSSGATATGYTGNITLKVSGGGCGYVSQTVAAVNGVATFSNIVFDRSVQTGITLTASASGFANVVSSTFNVTAPSGTPTTTNIINENFDGSTPSWSYTSSVVSDNTTYGTSFVGTKDYTTNPYGNSSFKKSLVKSHTVNNSSKEGESTNQIVFSNVTGLGTYNSVQVSFLIGSLPSQISGASGNGVDANENLIIETSLDGGVTWNKLLTFYGFNNYLLPLSSSSPATLAYNANASYNSDHSNSSTQSAFIINLPSGTTQFDMRLTATDNREEENWAIDNITIIGTQQSSGSPKALPTASGYTYSDCISTSTPIGVALANTQGSVTYSWSPGTNITSTTSASPSVSPPTSTTYTVTATDADGCSVSASDIINIVSPTGNVVLASTTMTAIEPSCPDASGWTYYTDPSNASNWVFGIYKNGNTFTANVDLTVSSTPNNTLNNTLKEGVFTMGRYWNVTIATGSINGTTNPVKARFFYNPADTVALRATAAAQAITWGLSSAKLNGVEWFKTNAGITYVPSNNTYNDVPNKLTPGTFTTTTGTVNGYSYVELDGLKGFSGGTAAIRLSNSGTALPVELVKLDAEAVNNEVINVTWITATEIENYGFDVERSVDGINFQKIGFVTGHGNSNTENQYLFTDNNAEPNVMYYYRLKQIDLDGNYKYTYIVSALLNGNSGFVMAELKPNPANGKVVVNAISPIIQTAEISISDMLGRSVYGQLWQLNSGLNGTTIDISELPVGAYFVNLTALGTKAIKRLIVVH